jgi:thiamine biosynthesis lipoprotein ApbE/Na+-translocating ferredoxin:NAD+ oxidoreductase RnfG subunit
MGSMRNAAGLLIGCLSLLSLVGLERRAEALDAAEERTEEVYLTRDQALAEVFPAAKRFESASLELDAAQTRRIQERCGRRLTEDKMEVFRALDSGDKPLGYAVVTDEIGKFQPITFLVGARPDGKITGIAVMVYRESIGSEVKRPRFLRQFKGKSAASALQVKRDIIHVAGATLSSRAIGRGAKKVLVALDECLLRDDRRAALEWKAAGPESRAAAGAAAGGAPGTVDGAPAARRSSYLMGTEIEITCYGEREPAERGIRAAFDEVARLEDLLSSFRRQSEVSIVNARGASEPVTVSADTFACVSAALEFARRSGGAFDPTLVKDGHAGVCADQEARSIRFLRPDLKLDLGGIGKGFALDRAAGVLEKHGVTRALLNFGGQILALDAPPGRAGWIVPVRDPRRPDEFLGHFELARASVASSGAYERGRHIIDPRTGKPAEGSLGATVCAATATDADALSTALFVLGDSGDALLKSVDRSAALIVSSSGGFHRVERPGAPSFVPAEGAAASP